MDVAVAQASEGAAPGGSAEYVTWDGLIVTVEASTKDGTAWATFAARSEAPPMDAAERAAYQRKILRQLADRAFRRPVDEETLDEVVRVLDSMTPADRPRIVAVLNNPLLGVRLDRSPLAAADGSLHIDTSDLTIEQVVDRIVELGADVHQPVAQRTGTN